MYTWKELAEKFEDLQDSLQNTSISLYWGYEGTEFNFHDFYNFSGKAGFQTLSEIAGKKLEALPQDKVKLKHQLYSGNDYKFKWYEALWNLGSSAEHKHIAHSVNKDGDIVGNIYTGIIRSPVEDSINLCLRLSEFDKEEPGWIKWAWDNGGQELVIGLLLIILGIIIEGVFGFSDLFK